MLTFLGFIATGSTAYFDLKERIAIQQVRIEMAEAENSAEKLRTQSALREMKEDLKEIKRGVDDLNRRRP